MNPKVTLIIVLLVTLLSACTAAPSPTPTATLAPSATPVPPTATPSLTPSPTTDIRATNIVIQTQAAADFLESILPDLELAGYTTAQGQVAFQSDEPIVIEASLPNHRYYDYLETRNPDFKDFVLGVDVKWDSKTGVAGCDILFRGDGDFGDGEFAEFSTMRLSGLPYWSMVIRRFNEFQGVLNEGASEAIKLSLGSTNHYVLAVEGSRVTVYANGVRLGVAYVKESMVEGEVGFQAWQESGITTCTFSNAWVFELSTEE